LKRNAALLPALEAAKLADEQEILRLRLKLLALERPSGSAAIAAA
jgi:hypothetical protein